MSFNNLTVFKNKRVLLLQGPVGPFFKRFADDIGRLNAQIIKINFNAGDTFFYPSGICFDRPMGEWPAYVANLIQTHRIELIALFGDCRSIHIEAKEVARELGVEVYVFEEGYLRPNHITLEHQGVNGYSRLAGLASAHLLQTHQNIQPPPVVEVGKTYWHAVWWAILYYLMAALGQYRFPHYQHHRPLTVREAWPWIRSTWRKQFFKYKERDVFKKLTGDLSQHYFLVPLQVHNDFQISHHSPYHCIEDFIKQVIVSFAQHAPEECCLVLKQHPFDRGYKDYRRLIEHIVKEQNVQHRVLYIHDQYLPDLLTHARGVVVINSTVGLSAVEELRPVKVCGEAVYNLPQLTAQMPLDEFWRAASDIQLNPTHVNQYLNYLCRHTQHNGSFYRKIKGYSHSTGVLWS